MVKEDGKSYSKNPSNGYIIKYPDGFFGYLGCGSNSHMFKDYKESRIPNIRSIYW